jgi:hypothetical protein
MAANGGSSNAFMQCLLLLGGMYLCLLLVNSMNRQLQLRNSPGTPAASPTRQGGGSASDGVMQEALRQSGQTTREMMKPQQFSIPDFSQVQGPQSTPSQTECISGYDFLGRVVTQCNQN